MRDDDPIPHDVPKRDVPENNVLDKTEERTGVSRRDFLKISSISVAAPLVARPKMVWAAGEQVPVQGPGKVPMEFTINGKKYTASLEPRVTLLDAMRDQFEITGPKRVCDRGECGACTVLMDKNPVYACSVLAIEAQARRITTVESLMQGGKLHPVQQAFVENDASQCGFCTPGFVVACQALIEKHPNPSPDDVRHGLAGNLCRCGTYDGIKKAIAQVAKGA
jgi:xanthine dehydrogenase YagT iron-sulfur-binding subunit